MTFDLLCDWDISIIIDYYLVKHTMSIIVIRMLGLCDIIDYFPVKQTLSIIDEHEKKKINDILSYSQDQQILKNKRKREEVNY